MNKTRAAGSRRALASLLLAIGIVAGVVGANSRPRGLISRVSPRKEVKELLAAARAQGWRVEPTRSGHYLLYAPSGDGIVTVGGTPGDRKALAHSVARMRRYGFQWKGR